MSKYTTGEIAKLCGVSVRTVQYYDDRGVLSPSALSEGGRRLYSEADLKRMKAICFLRSMDMSLNSIKTLMAEENIESILSILLSQQEEALRQEMDKLQQQIQALEQLKDALKTVERVSVESIGDIACLMEHKKKLRKVHGMMIAVGIPMEIIEIGTLILWIKTGIWWPFAVGMVAVVAMGIWISRYYFQRVAYICPQCHGIFKPTLKESFWAPHTPRTRKLKCHHCGQKSYCVETHIDALTE